jgi:hypothetical protein
VTNGSGGGDLASCPCGSAWFELWNDDGTAGAICIDGDGKLGGFTGRPRCVECGQPLVGRADRIRVVR